MAAREFARILGTERDRLNCPFYFRIGACRHGDRCSRQHLKPHFSQTLMIPHMYQPRTPLPPIPTSESRASASFFASLPDIGEFVDFYEDVLDELDQFGRVEDMLILQNMGEHMHGNTYVRFSREDDAETALRAIQGRFYGGQVLKPEFSPVTDFSESICGMFKKGFCERGDYCNFMHSRPLPRDARKRLELSASRRDRRSRHRSRSRSPRRDSHHRSRSPSASGAESSDEERESSTERRVRIAAWNKAREHERPSAATDSTNHPTANHEQPH